MGVVLLDSSAVVGFLQPDDALHDAAYTAIGRAVRAGDYLAISAVTWTEILTGAVLGHREEATVRGFVADFGIEIFPVDAIVAESAARIRGRHVERTGDGRRRSTVAPPDALILATAHVHPDVERSWAGRPLGSRVPLARRVVRAAARLKRQALRQLKPAVDDRVRDVDDAAAFGAGVGAQALEGGAVVDAVALHQDALRALDHGAPFERALELVDLRLQALDLGVAAQRHLDRALHRLRAARLRLRVDAAVGRARGELGVVLQRERDHRARGVGADLLDQRERVVVVAVQHDHRQLGVVGDDLLRHFGRPRPRTRRRVCPSSCSNAARRSSASSSSSATRTRSPSAVTRRLQTSDPAQPGPGALRSEVRRRRGSSVQVPRPRPPAQQDRRRREEDGIVAEGEIHSENDRGHPRSPVYPRNPGSDKPKPRGAPARQRLPSGPPRRTPAERAAMVERHLGLARHLALRYSDSGEPLDDLFQVASLGLVNAVDRFDPSRGIAFTTFAVPTILGELKRHFRDRGWAIHVPRDLKEASLRVRRAIADHHGDRPPTPAELAEATGLSLEGVLEALDVAGVQRTLSLDAPASSERRGQRDARRPARRRRRRARARDRPHAAGVADAHGRPRASARSCDCASSRT